MTGQTGDLAIWWMVFWRVGFLLLRDLLAGLNALRILDCIGFEVDGSFFGISSFEKICWQDLDALRIWIAHPGCLDAPPVASWRQELLSHSLSGPEAGGILG